SSAPGRARRTGSRRPARGRRATCSLEIGAGSRWPAPASSPRTIRPATGERPARSSRTPLLRGGLLDRSADPRIGAAAADVAVHGLVDLGIGGLRGSPQQRGRGHDLAGLTVTALWDADLDPGRLQRAPNGIAADGFDRHDLAAGHRRDGRDARADRPAIDVHGAGAAQRHAAAELATGEAELVPQRPQERGLVRYVD